MKNTKSLFLIFSFLLIFSAAQGADSAAIHEGSGESALSKKKKSTQKIQNCIKEYKAAGAAICKDFRKLNISDAAIKKALSEIKTIAKSDNMWWTEERVKAASKFLEEYKDSSSTYRVTEEQWCTLGYGRKSDEYEKSMAWAEERCTSNLLQALKADTKGIDDLHYMFQNLSRVGFSLEAQASAKALAKAQRLKIVLGAFSVAEIDQFITELAAAKVAAATGDKKDKALFQKKLKECYEMEKNSPESFKARRKEAPGGYDCASFDSTENP